jgi:hypothetical protein
MALFPLGILSAAGAGVVDLGSYDLLETQILGSAQASVVFSSLGTYSSTYKHLQIRYATRTTFAATRDPIVMRFNADTGSNYAHHQLFTNGFGPYSEAFTSQTRLRAGEVSAANAATNIFGASVVDILDPYSTTKNKTVRAFTGTESFTGLFSGVYLSTSSTTSLTLLPVSASNFVAGSRFSLYGIKG